MREWPLALLLMLVVAPATFGHEVRPAFLHIAEQPTAQAEPLFEVLWKQPAVQNGRLAIEPIFPEGCVMTEAAAPEITSAALLQRWVTGCDLSRGRIHIQGLSSTLTDVLVRLDLKDGSRSTFLLRPESPTLDLAERNTATLDYLLIGIEHLVLGIDHVLFVIALVLFIHDRWMLLKTITAFTIAHSITLALSVLGWVQLQQGPVEAVIALSIVFLARELLQTDTEHSSLTRTRPWLMALAFGLLHGLGFAGALKDIGLPEDSLWVALLLFNVGIEIGQLAVVAVLLAAGWVFSRATDLQRLTRISAYAMGCVAAYWTIDRTFLLL